MRGRKPKPTELKRLAGNPGRRPLNDSEPQFQRGAPPMPRRRLPREAQRFWRAMAQELDGAGLLTHADGPALELMAMHYALAVRAFAVVQAEGMYAASAAGTLKGHPAAQVFRDNSAAFRQYAAEFGLTPSSRSRLNVVANDEPTLAEILFAGVMDEDE